MRYSNVKRGRLAPEERTQIIELGERGLGPGQIALRLNRHPGTINFAMHTMGLKEPVNRTFSFVRKNGSIVRSFSADEDTFIQSLRSQGASWPRIAEISEHRFGHRRSAATIGIRLKMLANRSEAAQ